MKRFLALAATLAIAAASLTPLASQAQSASWSTVQYGYSGGHDEYRHQRSHARRHHVWQHGHWVRHGHRKIWIEGQWVRVRPGYGGHQRMGHWRDLDRDGVPDSRDHDRDNDGVLNAYDRDRDGDGVRNEHDRNPDNRYR